MILEGRVAVNGFKVLELATFVNPRKDRVTVDGRPVSPPEKYTYLLVNKPPGYLTAASDPRGRPTVMELAPPGGNRLYPVGRLDVDTRGLLILTDDGKLAFRIAHPRYGVEKKYLALVEGRPTKKNLDELRRGVDLGDGPTRPAKVRLVSESRDTSKVEVTIHEGRKRQVRRMLETVGHPVISLQRTGIAFLELGDLKQGSWRRLKISEVAALKRIVGL